MTDAPPAAPAPEPLTPTETALAASAGATIGTALSAAFPILAPFGAALGAIIADLGVAEAVEAYSIVKNLVIYAEDHKSDPDLSTGLKRAEYVAENALGQFVSEQKAIILSQVNYLIETAIQELRLG